MKDYINAVRLKLVKLMYTSKTAKLRYIVHFVAQFISNESHSNRFAFVEVESGKREKIDPNILNPCDWQSRVRLDLWGSNFVCRLYVAFYV